MDKHNSASEYLDAVSLNAVQHRRFIHSHPELSFNEYVTASYICKILDSLNVSYTSNIAGTGICAVIRGEARISANKSKTLLFRADMDALPITEISDKEYRSQNVGIMHACGHDAHTAILLGICEVLNDSKDKFNGCVKLVFQPGEETSGGAKPMIDSGILENPKVDACVALHVDPEIDAGKIRIKSGSLYASPDDFKITVHGKGGHGAEPEKCVDPIMISAEIIHALMNLVSREIDPFDNAVITVGSIHGGTASNIIPDTVEMTGTARSLTNEVRKYLKRRIGEVANGICAAYNAECDYEFTELFPPLINDTKLSETLYKSACESLGADNCIMGGKSTMAGEDFAYFSQERPSVLVKLGCRNEKLGITAPIHHSSFDIDESCLKTGIALFSQFVLDYLG